MNKIWIDYTLCIIVGALTGIFIIADWRLGTLFLLITIGFHIWRWKNWNKIYDVLVSGDEQ